jgi:hypothetical protein
MFDAQRGVSTVALTPILDLRHALAGAEPNAFGVGPDRAVYIVLDVTPNRPVGADKLPLVYRVLGYADAECRLDVVITGVPFVVHFVQPLGEYLLLTCSQSTYQPDGVAEGNARVYTRDGEFVRAFVLGDGIEDVQTTNTGDIWTSYFDEGVLRSFNGRTPIGETGLVAWNSDGGKSYAYDAPVGVHSILDCYAFNVASKDDVWLYYYTGFPLVRLQHRRPIAVWHLPLHYSQGVAVNGRYALFRGGPDGPDKYRLFELGADGKVMRRATLTLNDEDGEPLVARRVAARADTLTIFSRGRIYALRIDDAVAAPRPLRARRER